PSCVTSAGATGGSATPSRPGRPPPRLSTTPIPPSGGRLARTPPPPSTPPATPRPPTPRTPPPTPPTRTPTRADTTSAHAKRTAGRGVGGGVSLPRPARPPPPRPPPGHTRHTTRRNGWNEDIARTERLLARCALAAGDLPTAAKRLHAATATFHAGDYLTE